MADDKPAGAHEGDPTPMQESPVTGSNPPEARTQPGDLHAAAVQYSEQATEHKGTQDPYPVDPSNELLDGDDSPAADELSARGMRVADSGRALVPEDDPTGVRSIPPPNSNLELMKSREKMMVAADEADGVDPEIGREARKAGRRAAGEARQKAAKGDDESGGQTSAARTQPPKGRQSGVPKVKS